jgi:hypothetical protein
MCGPACAWAAVQSRPTGWTGGDMLRRRTIADGRRRARPTT